MVRSIRLRLQLWYGAILGATIVVLGVMLYFNLHFSWVKEFDARIVGNLHYLDVLLRRLLPPPGDDHPPGERQPDHPRSGQPSDTPPGERHRPVQPRERPRDNQPGTQPLQPPLAQRPRVTLFTSDSLLSELQLPEYDEDMGEAPVFAIWRKDGKLIHDSGMPKEYLDEILEVTSEPELWDDPPWRLGTLRGPEETIILIAQKMDSLDQRLKRLSRNLVFYGGLAFGLGLLGGWFVSARIFQPVKEISDTATSINAHNLSKRIETTNLDRELVPLGSALNAMFDRLDRSFQNQIRFTADASHELRTPLTVIKSQAEWALSRSNRPETDYREALDACLRGTKRMERLVEDLLELARTDAETTQHPTEIIDLAMVVSEAMALLSEKAKSQQIELIDDLQSVTIQASPKQIERLAINLIGNAITHNPAGTIVRVSTGTIVRVSGGSNNTPFLSVSDNGVGIEPEAITKLGERFFRCDSSRSIAGSGLGIALVKGIVEAHGAELSIESKTGRGSTFTVKFPAVPVNKTI